VRGAVVLVLSGVLVLGACGGGDDDAADRGASSTTPAGAQPIELRTSMVIGAEGAEPIATGTLLEASTLGGSPFCAGGTVSDSHRSPDRAAEPYGPVYRTITCPDGTLRMGLTPQVGSTPEATQGEIQPGSWTIVSGTGAFEGLRGSGELGTVYGPDKASPVRETLTGTVTR
jgi:hypothetical protein